MVAINDSEVNVEAAVIPPIFFDENIIKKATQITLWEKLQLLFRRKRYYKTVDNFIVTRLTYKIIKDKKYILNFERWQEPPQCYNCRHKIEAV